MIFLLCWIDVQQARSTAIEDRSTENLIIYQYSGVPTVCVSTKRNAYKIMHRTSTMFYLMI